MAIHLITGRNNRALGRESRAVNPGMFWAGCPGQGASLEYCAAISESREEGESACLCLVSALVIRPVLLCSVMWRFEHSATCSGKYYLYVYRMEYCQ